MPLNLHLLIIAFSLALIQAPSAVAASIPLPQNEAAEGLTARGVLRARQSANISAAITARLLEAPYKMGQYFSAGDVLAKFDCHILEAELAALNQKHETQRLKYDTAAELYKYEAAGKLDVSLARSEMQYAGAQADTVKTQLKDCTVHAPFNGYVTARHAAAFETPQSGQPLYSLQRAGPPELSIIAPTSWIGRIKPKQIFDFTVDETGETFQAKVLRIGMSVDPLSQTFEITAKPKTAPKALVGMSGEARFVIAP